MGQKINPISLRLSHGNRLKDSSWFNNKYFYKKSLILNLLLMKYYNDFIKHFKLPQPRLSIQYQFHQINIQPFICIPKQSRFQRSKFFRLNINQNLLKRTSYKNKRYPLFYKSLIENKLLDNQLYISKNIFGFNEYQKEIQKTNLDLLKYLLNRYKLLWVLYSNISQIPQNKALYENSINIDKIQEHSPYKFSNSITHPFFLKKTLKNRKNYIKRKFLFHSYLSQNLRLNPNIFYNIQSYSINPKLNLKKRMIQNHLENQLSTYSHLNVECTPFVLSNDWQSATFLADEIVFFLERKIGFLRIKNQLLSQLYRYPWIKGLRIICSGRLGFKGKKSQRASQEYVKYGETSLNTFDRKIDYASKTAYTPFGSVGVKVWICYK